MALTPVLQLIHVSDIHFKDTTANAVHQLNARRRVLARWVQYAIERANIGGWNEGTQGHYPKAPKSFRRFLEQWVQGDPRWYGPPDDPDAAQTWLLDSGDLTALGDPASMELGRAWLDNWCQVLKDCRSRRIYGNHDAWPHTQPVHGLLGLQDEIDKQQLRMSDIREWNTAEWITNPLSIDIPATQGSRIEVYALDSVCWGALGNTLAIGEIGSAKIEALREGIRQRTANSPRHFRILVVHHPLAFPYTFPERHLPAMILCDTKQCTRELRNDRNDPPGIGPLVHLYLSGHTHRSYPAGALPPNVGDIHQGPLSAWQLQLVGGPLMLNQSAKGAQAQAHGESVTQGREQRLYQPATTDASNCQAQILQFFADTDDPGNLTMLRIPVYSVDGSAYYYTQESEVTMTYETPRPRP